MVLVRCLDCRPARGRGSQAVERDWKACWQGKCIDRFCGVDNSSMALAYRSALYASRMADMPGCVTWWL
jgi:hypothetical protein